MTRTVTVRRVLDNGDAEVQMPRPTACSGDCDHCAGSCTAAKETIILRASNPIGAGPGDRVLLELNTRQMLGITILVCALPVVLFFLGWFLGSLAGLAPWFGGAGFAVGVAIIIRYNRRAEQKNTIRYRIVAFA